MAQVSQQRFGCYIGNIDRSVTLEVLRQVFSQCGSIIDCSLNGRDEDPYRYGFIDFASEDDRARAMKYNGFTLAGRKIKVGVSKGNVGRPEGFSSSSNSNNNNNNNNNNNSSGSNSNNNSNNNNMNNSNANSNNNMMGGMSNHQQPIQQPLAPGMGLATNFLPSVVQQQQQSAQLLIQLIQQGAIDVNNLTPEQQQILMASLLPQTVPPPTPGIPAMPPAAPMGYPPMPIQQQPWGAPRGACAGGYPGGPPMGRGMPYGRGPANPMPSEETVKLREVQRKQFLDVVRRDAEKYEKKLQERSVKEGRTGSASGSDDSSEEDEGDRHHRQVHRRREEEVEEKSAVRENNEDDGNEVMDPNINCNEECGVVEDERGETTSVKEPDGEDGAAVPDAADDREQI